MSTPPPVLLEHALRYALIALRDVAPDLLGRPTPCRDWDLGMLLVHANDSLAALAEGFGAGCVAPAADRAEEPCDAATRTDPADMFQRRAADLLALCRAGRRESVAIGDRDLPCDLMAAAGALEVAVHGWDISRACGRHLPIPPALSVELLALGALLVPNADRHPLFAARTDAGPAACPSDRLVAYLGRDPCAAVGAMPPAGRGRA